MVTRTSFDPHALSDTMKESAQQIWLAGLGAFAKAQQEGGKVFETLVKDGMSMQRKTQAAAEEKFSQATHKMSAMANQFNEKATGQWDRLETIFEDRVARALQRLGHPNMADIEALHARIAALEKQLGAKPPARKTTATSKASAASTPARKTGKKPARKTAR